MFHDPSLGSDLRPRTISTRRLALLIDAENVPRDTVAAMVAAAGAHGTISIRRAYGDWTGGALKGWSATLHDHAIRPVQQFSYTAGKNASDIALVIDAIDSLHTCQLDGFCIASSDSAFTPLALHLRATGRDVHGFGESKTPRPFRNACTTFVELGDLRTGPAPDAAAAMVPAPTARSSVTSDASLVALLRAMVRDAAADDGWASLGALGHLAKNAGVDPKRYGCKNYSALFKASALFTFRQDEAGSVMVTDPSRAAPKPPSSR